MEIKKTVQMKRLNYFKRRLLCLREDKVRFRHDWLIELDKMEQKFKRSAPFLAVQCHVLVPGVFFSSSYTFYPLIALKPYRFHRKSIGIAQCQMTVPIKTQTAQEENQREISKVWSSEKSSDFQLLVLIDGCIQLFMESIILIQVEAVNPVARLRQLFRLFFLISQKFVLRRKKEWLDWHSDRKIIH